MAVGENERASIKLSVVTPTLGRPREVRELFENLGRQTLLPGELILVDGAPETDQATEHVVREHAGGLPFVCRYIRHQGGTALQRNIGIDAAQGDYIAFIDDDIRLEPDFFQRVVEIFESDVGRQVGGIAGYITNQYLDPNTSPRWRWYRRLHLFSTYEPGRYDYMSGYPINRSLHPPFAGVRRIDFMGAGCAVWRHEVFSQGLKFGEFFKGHGVLEDAHFALRAGRSWQLLEHGEARCVHMHSAASREDSQITAWKSAVNYRYVFIELVPERTRMQNFRFWRVQFFDLLCFFLYAVRKGGRGSWHSVYGKAKGIAAAWHLGVERGLKQGGGNG